MSYTLVLEWMPGDLYMSAVTARCTAPTSSYSVVWLPPNKVYQITLYCGSTSLVSFLVGAFRGKAWSYMNKFEAERRFAQRMKDNYPPGTRIMLLQMGDDPRPIEPNTRGTVAVVDDMGTLHCHFDNGRQLGIVSGEDSFRRLTDQELAEEKDSQKRQLTEMSEDELYERDILRFDSFDDFFDFIYDENTDKADIINDMSQQMKRQIVSENYGERFIEADGAYYYNSECFTQMALPQSDKEDNAPVFGM